MKRYVLHPGTIVSKNDGQKHYINATRLASLYGVKMEECWVFEKDMRYPVYAQHLHPNYNGHYDSIRNRGQR